VRVKLSLSIVVALVLSGGVASADVNVTTSNSSENVSAESGDANGTNSSGSHVGHASSSEGDITVTSIEGSSGTNVQEGDNSTSARQRSNASTGDTVGGQALGVTSSGDAAISASNTSDDVDVTSGDAEADNDFASFVGLAATDGDISIGSIIDSDGTNVQEGNNGVSLNQSSDADSGDAVSGQVLGVVAAGTVVVDATNRSTDADAASGDADASNDAAGFVGLAAGGDIDIADIIGSPGTNVHEGDNTFSASQSANANSGDAITGQTLAGVTAGIIAGGTADVIVDNESTDSDARTGDSVEANGASFFGGLADAVGDVEVSDLVGGFLSS